MDPAERTRRIHCPWNDFGFDSQAHAAPSQRGRHPCKFRAGLAELNPVQTGPMATVCCTQYSEQWLSGVGAAGSGGWNSNPARQVFGQPSSISKLLGIVGVRVEITLRLPSYTPLSRQLGYAEEQTGTKKGIQGAYVHLFGWFLSYADPRHRSANP